MTGNVLLKFDNGANGILWLPQIATGEENSLKIKVYGEKEVRMASNGTQYISCEI
jgi:hypothetical protein